MDNVPQVLADAVGEQQADEQQADEQQADEQRDAQYSVTRPAEDVGTLVLVTPVTDKVKDEELRSALSSHGELVYFYINRQKNCAFVLYDTPAACQALIKSSPIIIAGESVVVRACQPLKAGPNTLVTDAPSDQGTLGQEAASGAHGLSQHASLQGDPFFDASDCLLVPTPPSSANDQDKHETFQDDAFSDASDWALVPTPPSSDDEDEDEGVPPAGLLQNTDSTQHAVTTEVSIEGCEVLVERLLEDFASRHILRRCQNEGLLSYGTCASVNQDQVAATHAQPNARRLTRRSVIHPAFIDKGIADDTLADYWAKPDHTDYLRPCVLLTNGSCCDNGASIGRKSPTDEKPTAGASYICSDKPDIITSFRLEEQGPDGNVHSHTSDRAKLRAVIAALESRSWNVDGWEKLLVVTDLEYVARGAAEWLPRWIKDRWRTPKRYTRERMFLGKKIMNRDLWEQLQARIDELHEGGTEVAFYLVKPGTRCSRLLRPTLLAARLQARSGDVVREYHKVHE